MYFLIIVLTFALIGCNDPFLQAPVNAPEYDTNKKHIGEFTNGNKTVIITDTTISMDGDTQRYRLYNFSDSSNGFQHGCMEVSDIWANPCFMVEYDHIILMIGPLYYKLYRKL